MTVHKRLSIIEWTAVVGNFALLAIVGLILLI